MGRLVNRCLIAAAVLLVASGAQAAQDDLASAILKCLDQQGEQAQLACYNRIALRLRAERAISVPSPAVPPPSVAAKPSDFGKESLPTGGDDSAEHDSLTAQVTGVTYNPFRRFTVRLDNGQVWRQMDGDSSVARFRNDGTEAVRIARGMFNSYHLFIVGVTGSYVVKRIK
ncbi:MAG: hypothetical protein WDN03_04110 [Rhizomicrobium sp.]